jgi:hypothetical protein
MNFKRLLHSGLGKIFISILLGLGIATLFRKVCTDKNCLRFKGPLTNQVDGKVFKHGEQCYKYKVQNADKCNPSKKVVDIVSSQEIELQPK